MCLNIKRWFLRRGDEIIYNNEAIRVLCIFGTRPEATKMAPLIKKMQESQQIEVIVCVTAQHRQMLDQVLDIFEITPDYDLDIMQENQAIADVTSRVLAGVMDVIKKSACDLVLVHGDTTTTFAAGLAAFYSGVLLGHVEAGLRSFNKREPFPEEINRRLVSVMADLNFAPTQTSRANLLKEGICCDDIFVTGNTTVDLMQYTTRPDYRFKTEALNSISHKNRRIITMTAHRRENYAEPLENICRAALRLVRDFEDVDIVYPVHLAPAVRKIVFEILGNNKHIHLIDPLDVEDLHNLMSKSFMVLTDSGGLQEEAPVFKKPVLVLRNVTERPEGIETGCLVLAGVDENHIYELAAKLLTSSDEYRKMANAKYPFGDGKASERIVSAILYRFGKIAAPLADFE